jgi:hypothetical protein
MIPDPGIKNRAGSPTLPITVHWPVNKQIYTLLNQICQLLFIFEKVIEHELFSETYAGATITGIF